MAEVREPDGRIADIARDLIRTEECLAHIADSRVRIAYLSSDAKKTSHGKRVLGQCEKVPAKWKWIVPFDFTVTVFLPMVEGLTDEQLRITVLHELMHVGIDADGDEEAYRIVPHSVEEFNAIIERYGSGWSTC